MPLLLSKENRHARETVSDSDDARRIACIRSKPQIAPVNLNI